MIGTQTVDVLDNEHACGAAYCRADHESDNGWFSLMLRYDDSFRCVGDEWLFTRRRERVWWSIPIQAPDVRVGKWPGDVPRPALLPDDYGTWREFWSR